MEAVNIINTVWKKEDIRELIRIYREYPCLWNVKLCEYKDRNMKDLAFTKMQEHLKLNQFDCTIDLIKKKIQILFINIVVVHQYRRPKAETSSHLQITTHTERAYQNTV